MFIYFFQTRDETTEEQPCDVLEKIQKLDICDILKLKVPSLDDNMTLLLSNILKNSQVSKCARRWDKSIIQFALQFWTRSPQAYQDVCATGFMLLPSVSLLQRYKNIVEQAPGFQPILMKWMHETAQNKELPKHGYTGGLIFDEMAIQPDLQIDNKGGSFKLSGAATYGIDGDNLDVIRYGRKTHELASHVLQLEFLGHTGFKFPFAQFPTVQAEAYHLYSIFWDAVLNLMKHDFRVTFVLFDGASANRTFLKMLFEETDPEDEFMTVQNMFSPSPEDGIVISTEPKHVIKRLRNNILASGESANCTRLLKWKGYDIVWCHERSLRVGQDKEP